MKKYLPYVAVLFAALIVAIGIGYLLSYQGDKYSEPVKINDETPAQKVEVPAENPAEKIVPVARQIGALNALDLSLDALTIGDTEDKVYKFLGQPNTTRQSEKGRTHLKYANVAVVLYQGKISALVSQTSAYSTPRGIHEGSTLDDVLKEYGTNYNLSEYDNDSLYEYPINSGDGTPCLLRFAVRNSDGKVNYISMRFADE